ncbi:SANT/Myb_domain [Hexamita inflata]|uniref:SANT/Myb domain n=1 Tax=Hexamita inflata TaxID=28002 RepID=A0AA86UIL5_9EUKA|nr:SANT/Myb domain [Hexamita inflata]
MPYQQKNRWTADEEALYQFLLKQYHCNFKEASKHFPSRSYSQCVNIFTFQLFTCREYKNLWLQIRLAQFYEPCFQISNEQLFRL